MKKYFVILLAGILLILSSSLDTASADTIGLSEEEQAQREMQTKMWDGELAEDPDGIINHDYLDDVMTFSAKSTLPKRVTPNQLFFETGFGASQEVFIYAEKGEQIVVWNRYAKDADWMNYGPQHHSLKAPSGKIVRSYTEPATIDGMRKVNLDIANGYIAEETGVYTYNLSMASNKVHSPSDLAFHTISTNGTINKGVSWFQTRTLYQYNSGRPSDRPMISLNFHIVMDNGYQYKFDLPKFNGVWSWLSFDSYGLARRDSSSCEIFYGSVGYDNFAPDFIEADLGEEKCKDSTKYNAFSSTPNAKLPETANRMGKEVKVLPKLTKPKITFGDYEFNNNVDMSGYIPVHVDDFEGEIELQIDYGSGDFSNPSNIITQHVLIDSKGLTSLRYDGKDKNGVSIGNKQISARVNVLKGGELHISMYDVEWNMGGVSLQRLNGFTDNKGVNAPFNMYFNDTTLKKYYPNNGINYLNHSKTPIDSRKSESHKWALDIPGKNYGDWNMIHFWTYESLGNTNRTNINVPKRIENVDIKIDVDDLDRVNRIGESHERIRHTLKLDSNGGFDVMNQTFKYDPYKERTHMAQAPSSLNVQKRVVDNKGKELSRKSMTLQQLMNGDRTNFLHNTTTYYTFDYTLKKLDVSVNEMTDSRYSISSLGKFGKETISRIRLQERDMAVTVDTQYKDFEQIPISGMPSRHDKNGSIDVKYTLERVYGDRVEKLGDYRFDAQSRRATYPIYVGNTQNVWTYRVVKTSAHDPSPNRIYQSNGFLEYSNIPLYTTQSKVLSHTKSGVHLRVISGTYATGTHAGKEELSTSFNDYTYQARSINLVKSWDPAPKKGSKIIAEVFVKGIKAPIAQIELNESNGFKETLHMAIKKDFSNSGTLPKEFVALAKANDNWFNDLELEVKEREVDIYTPVYTVGKTIHNSSNNSKGSVGIKNYGPVATIGVGEVVIDTDTKESGLVVETNLEKIQHYPWNKNDFKDTIVTLDLYQGSKKVDSVNWTVEKMPAKHDFEVLSANLEVNNIENFKVHIRADHEKKVVISKREILIDGYTATEEVVKVSAIGSGNATRTNVVRVVAKYGEGMNREYETLHIRVPGINELRTGGIFNYDVFGMYTSTVKTKQTEANKTIELDVIPENGILDGYEPNEEIPLHQRDTSFRPPRLYAKKDMSSQIISAREYDALSGGIFGGRKRDYREVEGDFVTTLWQEDLGKHKIKTLSNRVGANQITFDFDNEISTYAFMFGHFDGGEGSETMWNDRILITPISNFDANNNKIPDMWEDKMPDNWGQSESRSSRTLSELEKKFFGY